MGPEKTHIVEELEEAKKETNEIVEDSQSQNAEAGLDLSDPIWKHQWNLDCLAGDGGNKETIRDIIADIVGTAADMANIENDDEESPESLEEKENIDALVPETLVEEIEKSEDRNTPEDEKKGDRLEESSEIATSDIENQKVEDQDSESKDEAKVGIFITEDIEELIENTEDVADEVGDRICEEPVSGTEELTESKEKNEVETDKSADNEASKEETDQQNENLLQVEVQEEKQLS